MNNRRTRLRFMRLWRSRRMIWRVTLILVSLVFISLFGLLSSTLNGIEVLQQQQKLQPPPSQHGPDLADGVDGHEEGGKTPFRRPFNTATALSAQLSAETFTPTSTMLWFNTAAAASTEGGRSTGTRLFHSHGVACVLLTSHVNAETGVVTPEPPRLLASNMTWQFYERYMQAHPEEKETHDMAADKSKLYVRPLRQVEIQLLRQRATRSVWATAAHGMGAIVGITPVESTVLSSADELLVEQHLRAEDQPNANPDPLRFMALAARVTTAVVPEIHVPGTDKATNSLQIDVSTVMVKRFDNKAAASGMTTIPLVEVKSTRRSASAMDAATAAAMDHTVVSPAATMLGWRVGDAESQYPLTLDFTLDIVHPRQVNSENKDEQHEPVDEVYTDALQATVCDTRLVRMYGLTASSLQGQKTQPAAEATEDGIDSIPLNMPEGMEVMVGGPSVAASPSARIPGVVPLLYLEMVARDPQQQQSSPMSTKHRTVGLLWLHPAPFFVSSTSTSAAQTCVRLRSTAGSTKLYLLPGPTPADVLRQYYTLTGFPTLPPRLSLGYHHGLRGAAASTEKAVEALDEAFLSARVPLDSVWLTDTAVAARDTPFTWNTSRFPDAVRLQSNLWYGGGRRYIVVRTVPTIPITTRSPLFLEGRRENYFVTTNAETSAGWRTQSLDGVPSHVVDFANPSARRWYGNMLKYRRYVGSTNHTFASLQYAAPLVTADNVINPVALKSTCATREWRRVGNLLPMDIGHHGGFVHREVHQLLPVDFAKAVHEGMLRRSQYVRRALVLTENYYAGVQRYAVVQVETQPACAENGAVGTSTRPPGAATTMTTMNVLASAWAQLRSAVRQCVQLSTLGVPFSGANLAAALTPELLMQLQQQQLTVDPEATAAAEDALETTKEEAAQGNDGNDQIPTSVTAQSTTSPREAEELLVRWYQAGVFFAAMYAVEGAAVVHGLTDGLISASEDVAGRPWWLRLRVTAATKEAIHTNLQVRYALVPYLYTVAYNVSERGSSFFAPLTFVQSVTETLHNEGSSAYSPTCYALGSAVIVCSVTNSSIAQNTAAPAQRASVTGVFDLWTGVWKGDTSSATSAPCTPLRWLAVSGKGAVNGVSAVTASPRIPTSASLSPAYVRPGNIIATQNVLQTSRDDSAIKSNGVPALDVHTIHSTHMGANWTLTVALPLLPPRPSETPSPPVSLLIAQGDVYWDEGSYNSQQRPPATHPGTSHLPLSFPTIPKQAHNCRLHLKCFYEAHRTVTTTAQLVVEVQQTSDSCADALVQLQSHWQEEPDGFAERFARAKERRDARQHAREVEQNEREDRGLRVKHDDEPVSAFFTEKDLNGLRLPRLAEEAARNDLWHSHLLHRIRFLFQREEDAARLVDLNGTAAQPPLHNCPILVERRGETTATAEAAAAWEGWKNRTGRVPVSRSSPNSHEVLVDLSEKWDTGTPNGIGLTPLFGTTVTIEEGGKAPPSTPPTHTWRFVFPLN